MISVIRARWNWRTARSSRFGTKSSKARRARSCAKRAGLWKAEKRVPMQPLVGADVRRLALFPRGNRSAIQRSASCREAKTPKETRLTPGFPQMTNAIGGRLESAGVFRGEAVGVSLPRLLQGAGARPGEVQRFNNSATSTAASGNASGLACSPALKTVLPP